MTHHIPDFNSSEPAALSGAFFHALADRVHRELFTYWLVKRGDRAMPARADIDPVDIPLLLPDLIVIDVLDGGKDYLFRLVGTHIAFHGDGDFTGSRAHEAPLGAWRGLLLALMEDTVRSMTAVYSTGVLVSQDRQRFELRQLLLPLSIAARPAAKIIMVPVFVPDADAKDAMPFPWNAIVAVRETGRLHLAGSAG